ncbi:MAG TPA: Clp protease N-terminal domain-containing protein, partial [Geminicoccaceae bacterium]|nr:Clp protease N-terminal domain-containing protein [Geminicoccaceae bacterium]
MTTNLKSLIGKLDDTARKALEGGAGLCLSQTHYEVDIEHVLAKLLEADDTDLQRVLRHYDINASHLQRDLTNALQKFRSGNTRTPVLSPRLPKLFERAWLAASIDHGSAKIRSGHLLLALLEDPELSRLMRDTTRQFEDIQLDDLRARLADITEGSGEAREAPPAHAAAERPAPGG